MNTQLDPNRIAQALNQSIRQLEDSTQSALASARQNALKKQSVRIHSPVFSLVTGSWGQRLIPNSTQQWATTVLLVATLALGAGYWQYYSLEQQISELDAAILTGELPIEVLISQPSHT